MASEIIDALDRIFSEDDLNASDGQNDHIGQLLYHPDYEAFINQHVEVLENACPAFREFNRVKTEGNPQDHTTVKVEVSSDANDDMGVTPVLPAPELSIGLPSLAVSGILVRAQSHGSRSEDQDMAVDSPGVDDTEQMTCACSCGKDGEDHDSQIRIVDEAGPFSVIDMDWLSHRYLNERYGYNRAADQLPKDWGYFVDWIGQLLTSPSDQLFATVPMMEWWLMNPTTPPPPDSYCFLSGLSMESQIEVKSEKQPPVSDASNQIVPLVLSCHDQEQVWFTCGLNAKEQVAVFVCLKDSAPKNSKQLEQTAARYLQIIYHNKREGLPAGPLKIKVIECPDPVPKLTEPRDVCLLSIYCLCAAIRAMVKYGIRNIADIDKEMEAVVAAFDLEKAKLLELRELYLEYEAELKAS